MWSDTRERPPGYSTPTHRKSFAGWANSPQTRCSGEVGAERTPRGRATAGQGRAWARSRAGVAGGLQRGMSSGQRGAVARQEFVLLRARCGRLGHSGELHVERRQDLFAGLRAIQHIEVDAGGSPFLQRPALRDRVLDADLQLGFFVVLGRRHLG